jgi:hypothetical protein
VSLPTVTHVRPQEKCGLVKDIHLKMRCIPKAELYPLIKFWSLIITFTDWRLDNEDYKDIDIIQHELTNKGITGS